MAYGFGAFDSLEDETVDARFAVRGTEPPPDDVVVVQVDDRTFGDLGLQWPFPRSVHADLIDRLSEAGARVIAYDVQFSEPTEPREDNALIRAIARAGNVVLATTEVSASGEPNVLGGGGTLERVGARAGDSNLEPDPGAVQRRLPYSLQGLESFPVVATEVALGRRLDRSDLGGDTAWIDFHGPPGSIPAISFSEALREGAEPGFFEGKVVVVGASAPSLQDVHPTSTTGDEVMPGPEIAAHAISTALRGFALKDTPVVFAVALIVLLGMLAPVAAIRWPGWRAVALTVSALFAYVVAAQLVFQAGLVLPVVYPVGAGVLSGVGALSLNAITSAYERERVRDLFARFVPPHVVDQAIAAADGLLLGGIEREVTILLSDIRGFTAYSESRDPREVVAVLNRYLAEMSEAITSRGGTLVSYMGDGILAVFGAPLEQPDHADRALGAAREMLARLADFNSELEAEGLGEGFRMGIGLNTGVVMSGNVGSEARLDYTVIGDTVNTADRLQGMTKERPHQLLIADSTRTVLAGASDDDLAEVGEFEVRGRRGTVRLWALRREPGEAESPDSPAGGANG